jgi:hypothetical protein
VEKALSQVVQTERNLHLQQQSFTQQQRHSASSAARSLGAQIDSVPADLATRPDFRIG